jgi:hypothetical protein
MCYNRLELQTSLDQFATLLKALGKPVACSPLPARHGRGPKVQSAPPPRRRTLILFSTKTSIHFSASVVF